MLILRIAFGFSFIQQTNTGSIGNDLMSFSNVSSSYCQGKCTGFVYCNGFVMDALQTCYLKTAMSTSAAMGMTAYIKQVQYNQVNITLPNTVVGFFDASSFQTVNISGNAFGTTAKSISMVYLDAGLSVLATFSNTAQSWSNAEIIV